VPIDGPPRGLSINAKGPVLFDSLRWSVTHDRRTTVRFYGFQKKDPFPGSPHINEWSLTTARRSSCRLNSLFWSRRHGGQLVSGQSLGWVDHTFVGVVQGLCLGMIHYHKRQTSGFPMVDVELQSFEKCAPFT